MEKEIRFFIFSSSFFQEAQFFNFVDVHNSQMGTAPTVVCEAPVLNGWQCKMHIFHPKNGWLCRERRRNLMWTVGLPIHHIWRWLLIEELGFRDTPTTLPPCASEALSFRIPRPLVSLRLRWASSLTMVRLPNPPRFLSPRHCSSPHRFANLYKRMSGF